MIPKLSLRFSSAVIPWYETESDCGVISRGNPTAPAVDSVLETEGSNTTSLGKKMSIPFANRANGTS